ncbi:RNA pseudouridine synthase, partial [Prevotella copri]|nr:RNA pseudouridine synthase [Segatella copri]
MIFLDYIYNKVYAPVEDDFGFDDAGDMDELDDELQMEEETAASGEGGDELYEHWKVQVDANQDPVRIDKYLADKMAYQSRNRIQQAADAGFIH